MMDPVVLLEARSEDAPSGENLEYDPVFVEMELAAQPGEETQIGDTVTAAQDPEYREVAEKAQEVLEQSHDLRAAVYLADAVLHTQGLKAFADVTAYIRGCLEKYWDTCHPELDPDDDDDPIMRINAIQGLCGQPDGQSGPSPVYRSLRRVGLSDSRGFGRFSLRDIEIAEGTVSAPEGMENIPDSASVSAAFQDTDADVLENHLAAAKQAEEDIKAVAAVFDEKTPGMGPELDPLVKVLGQIVKTLGRYAGGAQDAPEDEDAGADAHAPAGSPDAGAPRAVGGIKSPADVSNALDRIIDYYRQNEPSSPIPILLMRAKRLVNADFLTIVQDMAPGGVDNVHLIGGIEEP